MIDTIVFDIGNVLADFRWQRLFNELGFDSTTFEAVADATVRSSVWNDFDSGRYSDEIIIDRCVANNPSYEEEIRSVFSSLDKIVEEYPYSESFVLDMKAKGFRVYLLSNFPKTTFEMFGPLFKFRKHVDGEIISYVVKQTKPDRDIYESLEDKYDIVPENTIFMDDSEKNIEAATSYGYNCIRFESYESARKEIDTICQSHLTRNTK